MPYVPFLTTQESCITGLDGNVRLPACRRRCSAFRGYYCSDMVRKDMYNHSHLHSTLASQPSWTCSRIALYSALSTKPEGKALS